MSPIKTRELALQDEWDVIIIGAGPTGLFAAYEIKKIVPNADVLIIEMGNDLESRKCPRKERGACIMCNPCSIVSGFGGAGAFSDGKLNLSREVGGDLAEVVGSSIDELIDYVDKVYLSFGAPAKMYGEDRNAVEDLKRRAYKVGMQLIPFRIRHMGTDGGYIVLGNFRKFLMDRGVEILFNKKVSRIAVENGQVRGVHLSDGQFLEAKFVVAAPGRIGSMWLVEEAKRLGIKVDEGRVDLGVRVEVLSEVMKEFTDVLYEPKLIYYSRTFDDRVRVFCVNPNGEVVTESYFGIVTVNGMAKEEEKTENTNFAVLVSTKFTYPYKDTISYALDIAKLANNIAGNQPIIQRLGDLLRGRRSTYERIARSIVKPTLKEAVPGDLSFVLPYRYLKDIVEMLEKMNEIIPGVYSDQTLLYGVEVKLHTAKLDLKEDLETKNVKGLYAGGDAAGVSRGLVQASASGVVIGRSISNKIKS